MSLSNACSQMQLVAHGFCTILTIKRTKVEWTYGGAQAGEHLLIIYNNCSSDDFKARWICSSIYSKHIQQVHICPVKTTSLWLCCSVFAHNMLLFWMYTVWLLSSFPHYLCNTNFTIQFRFYYWMDCSFTESKIKRPNGVRD